MPPTDDENIQQALATLGTGPAAKELYVDLLRPAAQELGPNLLTVARFVTQAMAPLKGLVWGLDKINDWLSTALLKRLAQANPEEIQTPPAYIAGQILLQLPFCAEEDQLGELYANLLSSAMQRGKVSSVHPAYVQVIQQLSPDEALLLRGIAKLPSRVLMGEWLDERGKIVFGYSYISDQFKHLCERGVASVDFSDAYLDNLLRLKVLEEFHRAHGQIEYANRWSDQQLVKSASGRFVQISSFGEGFLNTVVSDGGGA